MFPFILHYLLLYGPIQQDKGDSQRFLIFSFTYGCLVLPGLSGVFVCFFKNLNLHVPPTLFLKKMLICLSYCQERVGDLLEEKAVPSRGKK